MRAGACYFRARLNAHRHKHNAYVTTHAPSPDDEEYLIKTLDSLKARRFPLLKHQGENDLFVFSILQKN